MRRRLTIAALAVIACAVAAIPTIRGTAARADVSCDAGCADLSLTVSGPDTGHVGDAIEYDIVVQNNGPDSTSDAVVSDTLPNGASFVSASTTQGSCDDAPGGVLSCDLGELDYPGAATIAVTVVPQAPGSNLDSASVQSAVADPVADNNQDATDSSISLPPVVFTKVGPATAANNSQITYTLTTTFEPCICGPGDVLMDDPLPAGETFVSVTTSPATRCSTPAVGGTGDVTCEWPYANVPVNLVFTMTVVVNISTSASSITNTASETNDINGVTQYASATTTITNPTTQLPPTIVVTGTPNYLLTVLTTGCGQVSPAGQYAVYIGMNVVITATPCPGSRFTGWTGGPCAGTTINPCDVAIAAPTTITANFAP